MQGLSGTHGEMLGLRGVRNSTIYTCAALLTLMRPHLPSPPPLITV